MVAFGIELEASFVTLLLANMFEVMLADELVFIVSRIFDEEDDEDETGDADESSRMSFMFDDDNFRMLSVLVLFVWESGFLL